jgi:hypothetical protein
MIIALSVVLAIAILALFGAIYLSLDYFNQERIKWFEERQILLNRIENPQYRPPITAAEKQANVEEIARLREESEQFGLVGRILE